MISDMLVWHDVKRTAGYIFGHKKYMKRCNVSMYRAGDPYLLSGAPRACKF